MVIFWIFAGIVLLFGFVVFWGAPYVPSHTKEVERAFDDLYAVTKKDVVVDVGSGDGIILRLASKRGAKAVGYELNPALAVLSRLLSRGDANVSVAIADFWHVKLPPDTTLVYAFAVERDIRKLATKLQNEADRLGHSFYAITYGSAFKDKTPHGELGAHHLYIFEPLQQNKP